MSDEARLRQLDALFAEKVLGCHVVNTACACVDHKHTCDERRGDGYDLLPYTRSLDAAWEGAMRFDGFTLRRISKRTPGNDNHYVAQVWTGKNKGDGSTGEGHPAEALVLACLRAVGCSDEELA